MSVRKNIEFTSNVSAIAGEGRYLDITVHASKVLSSWKNSLFSFEWLRPDGSIKDLQELSETEQSKRLLIEELLRTNQPIVKPILGIGMMDNVEIGSGRAEFLTLITQGIEEIQVHIPKACEKDFKPFLINANFKK